MSTKPAAGHARYPGTKFDLCIVLEGEQGCGKSNFARLLAAGPGSTYFTDAPGLIAMETKERAELLAGKWIVELAELSGLARSETEGVKAFLSQPSDHFRPAYARVAIERPRTCVFIATTNARAYLTDGTGNRRFVPVPCGKIDVDKFQDIRDQIIAEADQLLRRLVNRACNRDVCFTGSAALPHAVSRLLTLPPRSWAAAAEASDARRTTDALEEAVREVVNKGVAQCTKLQDGREFISSSQLLSAIRLQLGTNFSASGLATWMAPLGFSPHTTGSKQSRIRGYVKAP